MKYEFGVTITTELATNDIGVEKKFDHVCVLDLRRCANNGPFPIEEAVLRKLANFRVAYEQMPMSLYSPTSRQENELLRVITEQCGNVMIISDHPVPLARFCKDFNIPFKTMQKFLVANETDYVPVQLLQKQQPQRAAFGSLGG